MSLTSNFKLMAEYNEGMNRRIYDAASTLSSSELAKNQGAFFGSIISTLNHVLVGDTIWLKRFSRHRESFSSLDYVRALEAPVSLDTILHSDFFELKKNREKMDGVIKLFVLELSDTMVSGSLSYVNTKGVELHQNFSHLLQHFFNHQTHHRGQVSTLLHQQGVDIGVTDLLINIPNIE